MSSPENWLNFVYVPENNIKYTEEVIVAVRLVTCIQWAACGWHALG
jgi:hypothetical protein